ncbi:MAG: peptidoglycan DD-metalloendopeptidase family protein [Actinobacteria bacterium]|nr:peptidoglycan DD-metalloendopeptidase family protein [Actinomycetota bacterium]
MGLKRTVLILLVLMLVPVLLNIQVAPAASSAEKQKEIEKIREEIAKSESILNEAASNYQNSLSEVQAIDAKIYANEFELTYIQDRLDSLSKDFDKRIVYMHKTDPANFHPALTVSQDSRDLMARASIASCIAELNFEASVLKVKLMQCKLKLAEARKKRDRQLAIVAEKHDEIYHQLALQGAAITKLNQKTAEKRARSVKLAKAALGTSLARGRYVSRGKIRTYFVFPVAGPNSYINSWGFTRSGGRRHRGTDIMAARGTNVVACVSGLIDKAKTYDQGLGGITIWLKGDDGNIYYYAHLNSIADGISPDTRVNAGQIIGTVGSTGNASRKSPHLHFEIHPGGGAAINPYPILRSVQNTRN